MTVHKPHIQREFVGTTHCVHCFASKRPYEINDTNSYVKITAICIRIQYIN